MNICKDNKMWEVEVILPRSVAEDDLKIFREIYETVSVFESENKKHWEVKIILTQKPHENLREDINLLTQSFLAFEPNIYVKELPQTDWLAENREAFPALEIAGFYIHGSHLPPAQEQKRQISIQVDASLAFGTGEHATTQGCLEMIASLPTLSRTANILDLGCGTAILAIAMAKLWDRPIIAADIDSDSVELARKNCHDNHVENLVEAYCSNGFSDSHLIEQAPYQLIVANILAKPLCTLAPQIRANSTQSADLILSGLLVEQLGEVQKAYEKQGFKMVGQNIIKEWATLHLKLC